jgi:alcohol dehydrogenase class IV
VVTDPQCRFKDAIRSDFLFPRCAIVDPLLTHAVPADVTAHTGFDTLAHAVESYVSPKAQPIADRLALSAVAAVCRYLPIALEQPDHAEARAGLALASTTMGWNLSWVGTCFPHRIDKALCALHPEISHGQSVALFYPHWIRFSHPGAVERFARIAESLDPGLSALPVAERAAACSGAVSRVLQRTGMSKRLRDFGVRADELPVVAENVAGDLSINPVPVRKCDVPDILTAVFSEM